MESLAAEKKRQHKHDVTIIWKYVLFRHNSDDEEIERAIQKAHELGVEIQFETSWTSTSQPLKPVSTLKAYFESKGIYYRSGEC